MRTALLSSLRTICDDSVDLTELRVALALALDVLVAESEDGLRCRVKAAIDEMNRDPDFRLTTRQTNQLLRALGDE